MDSSSSCRQFEKYNIMIASEFFINKNYKLSKNIIIPNSSFSEILNYLELESENGILEISSDSNFIQLKNENSILKTKLINADYPNLENLFKLEENEKIFKYKFRKSCQRN